jgi:hypothetical protein
LSSRTRHSFRSSLFRWIAGCFCVQKLNHPLNGFNIELLDFNGIGPRLLCTSKCLFKPNFQHNWQGLYLKGTITGCSKNGRLRAHNRFVGPERSRSGDPQIMNYVHTPCVLRRHVITLIRSTRDPSSLVAVSLFSKRSILGRAGRFRGHPAITASQLQVWMSAEAEADRSPHSINHSFPIYPTSSPSIPPPFSGLDAAILRP